MRSMLAALLSVLFSWDEGEWRVRGHPYVSGVYIMGANHEDTGPKGTDAYLWVEVIPKTRGENEAADDWALEGGQEFYFKYADDRSHERASKRAAATAARWAAFYQRQADRWKKFGRPKRESKAPWARW